MKLTVEQMLVSLVVSCCMSGINTTFAQMHQDEFILTQFLIEWGMHWALAYPCLLLLVPLARYIVQKLLRQSIKS